MIFFWPQTPMQPHCPWQKLQWPQWPPKPCFLKQLPDFDEFIPPGTKITNTGLFLWMESKVLLIFGNLSVRGCWGWPMLLFWKWIDKTQMCKPPECDATFFNTWKSILDGLKVCHIEMKHPVWGIFEGVFFMFSGAKKMLVFKKNKKHCSVHSKKLYK